jgi:hypothetical protein
MAHVCISYLGKIAWGKIIVKSFWNERVIPFKDYVVLSAKIGTEFITGIFSDFSTIMEQQIYNE